MSPFKLKITALIIGIGALLADQAIKFIFLWKIPANGIFLIKNWLLAIQIKMASNPFVAFSIPIPQVIIFILTLVLLAGLFYFLVQNAKHNLRVTTISLGIIIGAAISNLIDRIIHGAVVDYLNITIYNYHWATFNLADSLITIGALIIIIINFRKKI
ncbi:MAG: Lipoprotein signal peptidase [Parcubacteria group bacterium GW2011_GWC2_39_14]|nr:MAG: Lipoprotein signal peptidase [Parcubacteria group bacterium GW2011_GWC2_39_14]KKR53231.1 MAG: Lipoprotein signal peptidase [Parcubacteria group bacterium GW2011_GWA2_40_23]